MPGTTATTTCFHNSSCSAPLAARSNHKNRSVPVPSQDSSKLLHCKRWSLSSSLLPWPQTRVSLAGATTAGSALLAVSSPVYTTQPVSKVRGDALFLDIKAAKKSKEQRGRVHGDA